MKIIFLWGRWGSQECSPRTQISTIFMKCRIGCRIGACSWTFPPHWKCLASVAWVLCCVPQPPKQLGCQRCHHCLPGQRLGDRGWPAHSICFDSGHSEVVLRDSSHFCQITHYPLGSFHAEYFGHIGTASNVPCCNNRKKNMLCFALTCAVLVCEWVSVLPHVLCVSDRSLRTTDTIAMSTADLGCFPNFSVPPPALL